MMMVMRPTLEDSVKPTIESALTTLHHHHHTHPTNHRQTEQRQASSDHHTALLLSTRMAGWLIIEWCLIITTTHRTNGNSLSTPSEAAMAVLPVAGAPSSSTDRIGVREDVRTYI